MKEAKYLTSKTSFTSLYTQKVYSDTIGIDDDSVCSSKTENIKRQKKVQYTRKKERISANNFFKSSLAYLEQKNTCHVYVVATGQNGGDKNRD